MKLVFTIITVYVLVLTLVAVNQRRLMYHPDTNLRAPSHYDLSGVEAGKLTTEDSEVLDYWYQPAADGKPVVLYFHGNGGHLGYRPDFFKAAAEEGYGLLMLSYRGYGTSTGSPSEAGIYLDAKAAYMHLRQEMQIPEENIIIYGESLGTGVAIETARGTQVKMVALQAPYTSIVEIASNIYWWLPVKYLIRDKYNSISKLSEIRVPLLVLSAEHDNVVPKEHAEALYAAYQGKKRYHQFMGIGHNDFAAREVFKFIKAFE